MLWHVRVKLPDTLISSSTTYWCLTLCSKWTSLYTFDPRKVQVVCIQIPTFLPPSYLALTTEWTSKCNLSHAITLALNHTTQRSLFFPNSQREFGWLIQLLMSVWLQVDAWSAPLTSSWQRTGLLCLASILEVPLRSFAQLTTTHSQHDPCLNNPFMETKCINYSVPVQTSGLCSSCPSSLQICWFRECEFVLHLRRLTPPSCMIIFPSDTHEMQNHHDWLHLGSHLHTTSWLPILQLVALTACNVMNNAWLCHQGLLGSRSVQIWACRNGTAQSLASRPQCSWTTETSICLGQPDELRFDENPFKVCS